MHRRCVHLLLASLLSAAASGQAPAQVPVDLLRPLDQTVDDRAGLARSLRQIEPGLRVPSGFEQVYHVPGHEDLLMRVNGGLYAVFPSSQYRMTRRGAVALIPNNTVFYIGEPDLDHLPPRVAAPVADTDPGAAAPTLPKSAISTELTVLPTVNVRRAYWDGRVRHPSGRAIGPERVPRTVANDEAYRAHRLRELSRQVALASRNVVAR